MGLRIALPLFAVAFLSGGCGASNPPDIAATRVEIEQLIRQFHENMNRGDTDAVAQMLAPDFSISWGGGDTVYGRDQALQALKGFVDYHKSKDEIGKRKPMFGEIRVRQEGQIAIATYTAAAFVEGKSAAVETYTQVFTHASGKWLLLHDQRSPKP